MSDTCPVLTPEQRQLNEIIERAQTQMMQKVFDALHDAARQAAAEWQAVKTQENPPPHDYFASVVHQRMFLGLCGADAETMTGGDAELAGHLIHNQQNIVSHYRWTAKERED
jgi:GTPase SAR1 family protein